MFDCDAMKGNLDDFMQILEETAYRDCIPIKGTFELTARCNFNCNMCYVHLGEAQIQKQGRELTNEEWLEIARQAKDAGMLYLTLTGGEIFVRPGFRELYEALSQMGFLISILSNGYCINENVIEWLQEMPPNLLRITLYGASDETYEKVCGIKNGFTKVAHAVDLIKNTNIPFYMVSTLVKENQQDLEAMCQFANDKSVYFKVTTAVLKSNRGIDRNIEQHRIDILDAMRPELEEKNAIKDLLAVCGSYRTSFWITWNGDLQLCAFLKDPSISILEHPFEEAWKNLILELAKIKMPKECEGCKYGGFCARCPGVMAVECGSCSQVDKAFCQNAKKLYEVFYKQKEEISEESICRTSNQKN